MARLRAETSPPRWRRLRMFWKDPRQAWIQAEIAELRLEVDRAGDRSGARKLIVEAEHACERLDMETAWHHFHCAQQELIAEYGLDELKLHATLLLAEIEEPERLPQWRVKAVKQALPDPQLSWDESDLGSLREAVGAAMKIRNEGISNDFWRLAIVRHYQQLLILIGGPVLLSVIVIFAVFSGRIGTKEWAAGPFLCISSALLGILGAVISAAKRSTGILPEHVLAQLGSNVASLSRIPIGGVAGLTVWLFSIATAGTASVNAANLLLAAFGAGFAERLIVQGQPSEASDQEAKRTAKR
ncbi:hypothetical protein [Kribbella monticola]|uniref:hypothetical protein n=1 Tax=Kribbella monticola TaxID=2185285 RepID=UPI0013003BC6|nr:hypothetical protein [Kribbella monticola]